MLIKTVVVGPLQVNCYVIGDEDSKRALVIDPGDEPDRILRIIKEAQLQVDYVICTHGHFDHVGAVVDMQNETGAKVVLHGDELPVYSLAKNMAAFWGYEIEALPGPDMTVQEGDVLTFGRLSLEVFHTPGHSPGGICLYGENTLFTGDTLFAGSVGRTDFEGGDLSKLRDSFRRLMILPDNTEVLPGHGPASTIGREKRTNMFSAEFLHRK
ncbi:MAG: MBL fold metallo-hydrolase [Alphaproteobacteria bacterium]|uniref:MBL fold metallo-hydrolase n=1 Tax=Candidatus Nitrobium versatile TaxID=2884831 RepID=A0A953J3B9_9BACT|nr:MBL fold metallo-hydrolase [Candidatus Nitrobium versatile]